MGAISRIMIQRLSLFVPGLLAPVRSGERRHPIQAVNTQSLAEFFRHFRRREPADLARAFATLIGPSPWQDAAVLARSLQLPAARSWLFAAPVLLRPDHAGIYLLGSRPLQVSIEEAATFCAELNPWLAQDGMCLYPVSASRWLLALPENSGLTWTPLADAVGVDLRAVWPQGENALRWQSRLTEWQMLLNQSACNQQRQQRGLPPAHAIWLWGNEASAGQLSMDQSSTDQAATDQAARDPAPGVAKTAFSTNPQALPTTSDDFKRVSSVVELLNTESTHAVVLEDGLVDAFSHGDVAGYEGSYARFLATVLAPLQASWQRGTIRELALYPDDGHVYLASVGHRWQFWRRAPLPAVMRNA